MATYAEMLDQYRGNDRGRYEMAVREQAFIFSADGRPDIAALAVGVISNNLLDIDAVIAGIVTGPNSGQLDDDGALLAAVQAVWPTAAAARYPAEVA